MLEAVFNKVAGFQSFNFIREKFKHRCFPMNIAKFLRTPIWKTSTNGCFCRLQKILRCHGKSNWSEVWIKIKIHCLLWSDFTTCPSVFIVDFEQVNAGWEAKGGQKKQVRSTKISLDIFIETACFFASFAYWKFQTGKILSRKKQ